MGAWGIGDGGMMVVHYGGSWPGPRGSGTDGKRSKSHPRISEQPQEEPSRLCTCSAKLRPASEVDMAISSHRLKCPSSFL